MRWLTFEIYVDLHRILPRGRFLWAFVPTQTASSDFALCAISRNTVELGESTYTNRMRVLILYIHSTFVHSDRLIDYKVLDEYNLHCTNNQITIRVCNREKIESGV